MQFQAKTAWGALVVLLGFALSCTPALAQQNQSNNPPPPQPQAQGNWSGGPGGPGAPPPREAGMRVWRARGQGRGWAAWRSRDHRGWGSMLGMGDLGLGNLRILEGFNGPLLQAQRALHNPEIRQALGISDDQAKKLEDEVTQFRKTMIRDHAELQIQLIDLQTALAEQTPDRSKVDDSMQKVSAAQQALEKAAVDFVVTLKQEITPEQRQKIRQFLRARRGQGFSEERWEDRDPRRPGSGSFAGSQPPNGSAYYTQNEAQLNGPPWQNSQGQPEQSPAPQPYTMGEPQGSTPMTNNQ